MRNEPQNKQQMDTSDLPYPRSNAEGNNKVVRVSYEDAVAQEARSFADLILNGSIYHVTLNSGRNYRIFKVGKAYILTFRRRPHLFVDNLVQTACFGGLEILSVVRVVGAVPRFWVQTTSNKGNKPSSSSELFLASGWQRTPAEAMKVLLDKVGYMFVALHKGDAAKAFGITSTEYACKLIRHPDLEVPVKALVETMSTQIANLTPVAERSEVDETTEAKAKIKRHHDKIDNEFRKAQVIEKLPEASGSINATIDALEILRHSYERNPPMGIGTPSVLSPPIQFPSPLISPYASPFGFLATQSSTNLQQTPFNSVTTLCDLQNRFAISSSTGDISAPLDLVRSKSECAGVERLRRVVQAVGLTDKVDVALYRRGKIFANEVVKDVPCDENIRELVATLASLSPEWTNSSVFKKLVTAAVTETAAIEHVR